VAKFPSPKEMTRKEIERAYSKVKDREKACINCVHAEPFPYPMCQLVITCMRKPPAKTNDWKRLRFDSAMVRFQDASDDVCGKFRQRESPEVFLRRLVWIKRFVWFLNEKKNFNWVTHPSYSQVVKEFSDRTKS